MQKHYLNPIFDSRRVDASPNQRLSHHVVPASGETPNLDYQVHTRGDTPTNVPAPRVANGDVASVSDVGTDADQVAAAHLENVDGLREGVDSSARGGGCHVDMEREARA